MRSICQRDLGGRICGDVLLSSLNGSTWHHRNVSILHSPVLGEIEHTCSERNMACPMCRAGVPSGETMRYVPDVPEEPPGAPAVGRQ